MADAVIDMVGPDELPLIVNLYNQIFRPSKDADFFRRRFRGRYNVVQLAASVDGRPVGFFIGFELKPGVFFTWFYGVVPEFRRKGIASQLMEAVHEWARTNDYDAIRFECHNQHRPMLHLAITQEYDILGVRWDPDRNANLVLFQKTLNSEADIED